ncbi:MAG: hypothetical protein PUC29_07805 [Clostridia bacterium]|nr:hypothetical protein [Clostridia bacterium]
MEKNYFSSLIKELEAVKASGEGKIPGNAYYMEGDRILCCERSLGESRFPYSEDGLVVWLRSTGFIDACESKFTIFRTANFGEESPVEFFGGIKGEEYFPVSITGAGRQLFENGVKRYIVYSLRSALCIADTPDVIFAMRLFVDKKKKIHFTLYAENKSGEIKEIYLASFVEALLRYDDHESFWDRMRKFGEMRENGFILKSKNGDYDCLAVKRKIIGVADEIFRTCSRNDFTGMRGVTVANALSLKKGKFERQVKKVTTTDLPVAAEIIRMTLGAGDAASVEYELTVCHGEAAAEKALPETIDEKAIEKEIAAAEQKTREDYNNLKISFDGWKTDKVDSATFNKFLRSVQNQTSFCAHGKNYAGAYLGIRDVFQQLEGALVWQRELSREKIVNALNYILKDGRPPRMFSIPDSPENPVPLDLEKYIDQGNWIISTVYTYLAFTDDWSILEEKCNYLDAPDDEAWADGVKTGEVTTVLEHLVRITDFLLSNIDTEYTNCLKVLFGDWNDAVDGLGETDDEGKEFGTGVTVMASLQLRKNLFEMLEITAAAGQYTENAEKYKKAIEGINAGLDKYAVDTDENGNRRIVHGWGDKVAYKVGSFKDPDGVARYSLTSNAFWAISGFVNRDPSLKSAIMDCVDAVSSKYGLKTFDKPFYPGTKGVGRICNIVPGTYENCCAYAHGSLFGTMGLFAVGESERAWREIEKTAVITHENATMSTFVMPNSYCENAEYGLDGESLGDWHTGSGCVMIKEMISCAFGIVPTLDGVKIQPPAYFPSKKAEIEVNVKNTKVHLIYADSGKGERTVTIDGAPYSEHFDEMMNTSVFFIPADKMGKEITVKVCD